MKIGRKLRSMEGSRVMFMCPGCDEVHAIPVNRDQRPSWSYNENPDAPTFQPSILVNSHEWHPPVTGENLDEYRRAPWPQQKVETICHSYVTDGRIQFLGDCTHALVGQTVELPDMDDWT